MDSEGIDYGKNISPYCFSRKTRHISGGILKSDYCIKMECITRESLENSIIHNNGPFKEGFSGVMYNVCEIEDGSYIEKCNKVLKVIPLSENDKGEDLKRGSITFNCNPLDSEFVDGKRNNSDCVVTTVSQFLNEVETGILAWEAYVGPKIHDYWICENVELKIKKYTDSGDKKWIDGSQILGFILMEKLEGENLKDFIKKYPELFRENFYILLSNGIEKAISLESRGYRHMDLHNENIFVVNGGKEIMFVDYGDAEFFPDEIKYITELYTIDRFLEEMSNSLNSLS